MILKKAASYIYFMFFFVTLNSRGYPCAIIVVIIIASLSTLIKKILLKLKIM